MTNFEFADSTATMTAIEVGQTTKGARSDSLQIRQQSQG
jgi:hypothetical protein